MFDDDFLHSLPDDPDEGLAVLFKTLAGDLEGKRNEASGNQYSTFDLMDEQQGLLVKVFAFITAHNIDLPLNREAPGVTAAYDRYYRDVVAEIQFYIAKTSFERAARAKSGTAGIYVLPPALKSQMHHYIAQVRELIANAQMSDTKRAALSAKLNAFALEVDRDRTRIEALAAAFVWTRKEVAEGAKDLEPIVEKLDKMFQSMAKATEWLKLPSPGDKKQLPSPPKRIEHKRELDDEVPF